MSTKKLKGKDSFTESEIEQLFDLIHQRVAAPSNEQKKIRRKMRKSLKFFGKDDWGIYDLHAKNLALLIQDGHIKITRNL